MANHLRIAAVAAAAAIALAGCGGDDEPSETSPIGDPAATEAAPEATQPQPETAGLSQDDERAVREATNGYIRALNDHDGEAVCALLAPDALAGVRFPESGPDCASSLDHSIGFEGPGGTPVWRRTRVNALTPVSVEGDRARVTATVSHDFSDRPEPSVEEDVIYLQRSGDGWVLAKASASLYRAIGYPEPPLRALTPP